MRLELIYEPYNFEEKENWLPPSDSRYCQIHNYSMILQLCNSLDVCVNFEIHLRSTRAHWRHPATENLMKNQNMYDRVPDCVEVVTFVLTFFQLLDIFKNFLISNIFWNFVWEQPWWVLENIPFISSSSVEFIVSECSLIPFGEMLFLFGSTAAFACCSKMYC